MLALQNNYTRDLPALDVPISVSGIIGVSQGGIMLHKGVSVFALLLGLTLAVGSSAQAQTPGFRAVSSAKAPGQRGISIIVPELSGGIFGAQLRVAVPLIGWLETFGGCPDGNTGTWTFDNVPGYGRMTSGLVNTGKRPGCEQDWVYNTLYYTMDQPIPYGFSDSVKAHWQSPNVGPQHGNWTAAYTALSRTRPYFDLPCGGCLPFGGTGYPPSNWLVTTVAATRAAGNKLSLWRIEGDQVPEKQVIANRSSEWQVLGQRDFDGDGKTDILWGDIDGRLQIWFMDGFIVKSKEFIGRAPADSTLVGTGALLDSVEVNGTRVGTLLWRHDTSGDVRAWFMNGSEVTAKLKLGNKPADWTIVGSDNRGDIIWRNSNGDVEMWQVTGTEPATVSVDKNIALDNMPTNWEVAGLGDFDGNGYIDILWHEPTTVETAMWLLRKKAILSKEMLPTRPTNWTIVQTGDYRGAGRSDILWSNRKGDLQIWFMKGSKIQSKAEMGNIGDGTIEALNSE